MESEQPGMKQEGTFEQRRSPEDPRLLSGRGLLPTDELILDRLWSFDEIISTMISYSIVQLSSVTNR